MTRLVRHFFDTSRACTSCQVEAAPRPDGGVCRASFSRCSISCFRLICGRVSCRGLFRCSNFVLGCTTACTGYLARLRVSAGWAGRGSRVPGFQVWFGPTTVGPVTDSEPDLIAAGAGRRKLEKTPGGIAGRDGACSSPRGTAGRHWRERRRPEAGKSWSLSVCVVDGLVWATHPSHGLAGVRV